MASCGSQARNAASGDVTMSARRRRARSSDSPLVSAACSSQPSACTTSPSVPPMSAPRRPTSACTPSQASGGSVTLPSLPITGRLTGSTRSPVSSESEGALTFAANPACGDHARRSPTCSALKATPSASSSRARGGLTPRWRAVSVASTPGSRLALRAARSMRASVAPKRVCSTVQCWPSESSLMAAVRPMFSTGPLAETSSCSGPIKGSVHGTSEEPSPCTTARALSASVSACLLYTSPSPRD